ncbi:MAG: hypothetical protein WCR26_02460 [Sphaerochaetaceae bacterium]
MKKRGLLIVLIILIIGSSLFAYTGFPNFFYPDVSFRPTSARIEAMGGTGVATATGNDALYYNPANLASRKFSLNLPSVSVTLFNPKAIIDEGIIESIMEMDGDDTSSMLGIVKDYFDIVRAGKGEVLTTDIALGFTAGGFGLGINVQEQLHTHSSDGSFTSDKLMAEVNVGLSLGYGYRIKVVPNILSIDVGASVRFAYKAYTNRIGASELMGLFGDEDADIMDLILTEIPLAAGWAIPIDIGVNFNLPVGFRVSAVARDINGKYTMKEYPGMGLWLNEMTGFIGVEDIYEGTADPDLIDEFAPVVPWKLDLGVAWAPSFGKVDKFVKPTIAVDLVDTITMFEKVGDNPDAFWNYFRAGAEVRLLSVLDVRAGFNQGYFSVGVGLDLFAIKLDASYYWREFGKEIGDKPVDALTVRVNLGFDR